MNRNTLIRDHVTKISILFVFGGLAFTAAGCGKIKEKAEKLFKEATKPEVPVDVDFRKSLIGKGKVAIFRNRSSQHLRVTAVFRNSAMGESKTDYLDLSPDESVEIGWAEGWKFLSGETITLSHDKFSSKTCSVP